MAEHDTAATVMVVDDTPQNLRLLDCMLQNWGYTVHLFTEGLAAMEAALRRPPDIFLLDIHMPEIDGLELCRRFKADARTSAVPVIFLSAYQDETDIRRAKEAGGADYIIKPFRLDDVHEKITRLLGQRAPAGRATATEAEHIGEKAYTAISGADVMIVDDSPRDLKLLENLLQERGGRVLAFPRAELAWKAALRQPPDLILLDVKMPEMSGFDLCRRLQADERLRTVPVIFISILDETMDKVTAFRVGGVDYVTKPFQVDEVLARVSTHLKLHRLQKELELRLQQQHRLERHKETLVSMIIHDMRAPLQGILGMAQLMLQKRSALNESLERDLHKVEHSALILTGMINDVLDVTRLEEGNMPLEQDTVDIRRVAETAVASLGGLGHDRDFAVTLPPQEAPVRADADIIRRVIVNFLANAFKYVPPEKEIRLAVSADDERVRVEVRDRGPGIPREYHAGIFNKFARSEAAAAGHKLSTGLGLTFCKLAVEAHGGRIGLESEEGHGSTFWFELPRTM